MRRSLELKKQLGLTPLQELQTTLKTIQVMIKLLRALIHVKNPSGLHRYQLIVCFNKSRTNVLVLDSYI